ncbi:pentapeptide repeat-containing protein [Salmonella enterica]|uniref:pentapeptide repeat-containing protein n=1 Tax=Salmonella enterica TaxID=28901 RepID=UPI000D566E99|nr:pentapeptide repeat-containing protein [Salmonella enterica]EBC5932947.1 pentapeptide repeat-containing protein [Salmonella enterica]EGI8352277.1 pentapeptide repeat-containing protein [Salmonella enterica]EHA7303273.1 pentapeptide repeat-containing protein [Salmonella enterica]EHF7247670.1 pentapeptide repeat-containing protein [Salmonella enterica]EHV4404600.1 pentapeptide repeat-containing protein [Salmonella enterica]
MNSADLSKILEEHKVWITSMRESGSRANLCDADLFGADLLGADLRGANLRGANLFGADLCGADLCGADLRGANLRGANLFGADLCGADLCGADLCSADLRGANLCGANLPDLTFVILGEKYFISITNGEYVRAGCQNHTVEEWRKYSKQEIAEMDGRKALKFYPRLLDIIDFYIGKGERPDWLTSKEYADEVTE